MKVCEPVDLSRSTFALSMHDVGMANTFEMLDTNCTALKEDGETGMDASVWEEIQTRRDRTFGTDP